ncbi:YbhB/YbcL family Raf kinase inhibitor-like protein [Balneatrix alpica]|uniref:YbhB/YbcL family Raf kinase inhibitor-like protein n=1 Tax=Balneatrix alpica TaxID=75684 RepID=UPI0027382754|nr:YbhB/YbcL family Raf kinase inhibitor-like protein [Balneatrix alpica]
MRYAILSLLSASLCQPAWAELQLQSETWQPGQQVEAAQVFQGFGCSGDNLSPQLSWSGAPAATRSFAVTLYDPDAPTGSGWWHWLVFNLPASQQSLPAGAGNLDLQLAPAGSVQSRTDFASNGYGGPCPPQGDAPHRYQLKVFALDVESLPLGADSPAAMVGYFLNQHKLAEAMLEVQYSR